MDSWQKDGLIFNHPNIKDLRHSAAELKVGGIFCGMGGMLPGNLKGKKGREITHSNFQNHIRKIR